MSRPSPNPAGWLWATGAATLVVAARWREIELHSGEIPFLDQWLVEARQIIIPWLDGKLTFAAFFQPHHEHWPVWTRLIVWLETALWGQWNNQLQATLNAVLMGSFVGLFAAWLRRTLPLLPALLLTLLAVVLASLPHSWENIVWGFQSPMPLALLFVFVYLQGSLARAIGTAGWWLAQAAGLAALFTLGSMWAAPLAILLTLLWTSDWNWKRLLPAALLTLSGIALLIIARLQQPTTGAYAMGAANLPQFLTALLMQLGWPSAWPGAALLGNLPIIFLALRLRGKKEATALDRTVLALALWAAAQAVAFAYARGSYSGFVSRYADLLALGVLANGIALWRLFQGSQIWSRVLLIVVVLGWSAAVGEGLRFINSQGHTLYFHEHSASRMQLRRAAVTQFLSTNDPSGLSLPETQAILFPNTDEVVQVLERPDFAALLPASVGYNRPRSRGDFYTESAQDLRRNWEEFAYCGGLLLFLGLIVSLRNGAAREPMDYLTPSAASVTPALAILALGSGALIFSWPHPFDFHSDHSWTDFITPADGIKDLKFHIITETNYPKDNLVGGAGLWPENFRNAFFGTHIDGPAFTGVAQSDPFPLSASSYIIPFAGYPASAGNALLLRIEDDKGNLVEEITCREPNQGTGMSDIGFWEVNLEHHRGKSARLVLQDQRSDNEGWVAVAPPYSGNDSPKISTAHHRFWAAQGTHSGLRSLQIISATLALLAAISLFPPGRRLLS